MVLAGAICSLRNAELEIQGSMPVLSLVSGLEVCTGSLDFQSNTLNPEPGTLTYCAGCTGALLGIFAIKENSTRQRGKKA
jgi:hypothetical protein